MKDDDPLREYASAIFADLRMALLFLTGIPATLLGQVNDQRPDFRRAARAFPLVGALIGGIGGTVILVAVALGLATTIAAALAVTATVLVTGALHEDGLADTADGFGGGGTTLRKLEIMDDSRIGTFGTVALLLSLLLRIIALAALIPAGAVAAAMALIAAEAASRGALVRLWHELPAARPGGMADGVGPPDDHAMLAALAGSAIIVAIAIVPFFGLWAALVGALVLIATAFGFARLSANQIGGQTGDTLGACQQCTSIAFLIAVAAFA